jgi:hypothetical protein
MATSVPPDVRQLATELADAEPMRRGSLSDRMVKCGKPGCACAQDPKASISLAISSWGAQHQSAGDTLTREEEIRQRPAGKEF